MKTFLSCLDRCLSRSWDENILSVRLQWLYRLAVEEVPEHDFMLPLSEAEV